MLNHYEKIYDDIAKRIENSSDYTSIVKMLKMIETYQYKAEEKPEIRISNNGSGDEYAKLTSDCSRDAKL